MKRKILSVFITILAFCTCMFTFTACGDYEPPHTHSYANLKYDNEYHWFECECEEKNNITAHNIINGQCVCGYVASHTHEYNILKNNETQHWYECACGDKKNIENHKPGAEATETTDQKCTICNYVITPALGHVHTLHLTKVDAKPQSCTQEGNIEYYTCDCRKWFTNNTATTEITDKSSVVIEKDEHSYSTLKKTATEHWWECSCGDKERLEGHHGGTATCTDKAKCEICNTKYGSLKEHNYTELKKNESQLWRECICGDKEFLEYVAKTIENIEVEKYGFIIGKNSSKKSEILSAMNKVIDYADMGKIFNYFTAIYEERTPTDTLDFPNLDDNTNGTLQVYTEFCFAPFEFVDDSNNVIGVDVYLIMLVCEELNMKLNLVDMPFESIFYKVATEDNAVGANGIVITDERKEIVDFSDAYISYSLSIISTKDQAYTKLEQLVGKKIGVQKDTPGSFIIEEAINSGILKDTGATIIKYDSATVAFMALLTEEIDFVVLDTFN